jgi:1,2-diacylglycerol 3-alpha-glucosyltransferase
MFCRQLQAVIAPTEKVRKMLESYGVCSDNNSKPDSCKVYVVPTGIDPTPFDDRSGREEFRAKYGISADTVLMVAVGRLGKEKNYEEVLDYLSRIDESRVRLLLVGDGPDRASLERQAEELKLGDRIIFAGMIPHSEIASCYTAADLFVCASSSETQGLTYLEAQAASLPILCRRDDCLNDVVVDGENGWQYDTFDEFSEHLTHLLDDDLRHAMGANARRHMAAHYSAAAFASHVLEIYQEVLDGYVPEEQERE